jgi:hypothetical protein
MESAKILPDARVDPAWIASRSNDPAVKLVEIDVSAARRARRCGNSPAMVQEGVAGGRHGSTDALSFSDPARRRAR